MVHGAVVHGAPSVTHWLKELQQSKPIETKLMQLSLGAQLCGVVAMISGRTPMRCDAPQCPTPSLL